MAIKFTSVPTKTLAESITSAATSFQLNNITGWDGDDLVTADFGSVAYGIFRNATNTTIELFEFDPTTIASASITILRRGLQFDGDLTTEVSANKLSWTKGDTYVDIGTDTPQVIQWLKDYIDDAAIAGGVPSTTSVLGLVKMSTAPASAASPIAVGDNDTRLPTQAENDAMGGDATPSSVNKFLTKGKSVTAGATINGATTPVPVYQNKTDNEFYACDANDTSAMKFLGFAISNGTDGNSMNVQFTGIVSGFTGLAEGEKYYVQDAVGTIGTTPGTQEILVGIAISETELVIRKGTYRATGNGQNLGTASGSLAITTGFRPSIVRIRASGFSSSTTPVVALLDATFINGTGFGLSSTSNPGGTPVIENSLRLYQSAGGANYMTFSITSITDTGFTVTWTESGTYTQPDDSFYWEAEGEL